jgi:hypothetical protein
VRDELDILDMLTVWTPSGILEEEVVMAGRGPAAKHPSARRRRNVTPGFVQLPASRVGAVPDWPLVEHPDELVRSAELAKWAQLWGLPQATQWERINDFDTVAMYVRLLVHAQLHPEDTKLLGEWRQFAACLGITAKNMRDLRWEVAEPEVEVASVDQVAAMRRRVRVVD